MREPKNSLGLERIERDGANCLVHNGFTVAEPKDSFVTLNDSQDFQLVVKGTKEDKKHTFKMLLTEDFLTDVENDISLDMTAFKSDTSDMKSLLSDLETSKKNKTPKEVLENMILGLNRRIEFNRDIEEDDNEKESMMPYLIENIELCELYAREHNITDYSTITDRDLFLSDTEK
ncbi:hypothetical protein [Poseidonibacter ostreae]|uniref:Uncharacterized protein n=1 Tax=Poseidonibacter ostreae TaxID=2654171 RepID=A0A6L4WW03_9BACT|nr:hypothetical protein [Poseidonibacter ostreae]KAB7891252.1 hypothetical protein GBG19_00015 [Poseidonibacter ostreae]